MNTFPVFIGYDSRQPVAFQVAAHSIWRNTLAPVQVTRLGLAGLPITRRGLTDFTYARFMVPWLCGYEGFAAFMDSDVMMRGDARDLFALAYLDQITNGPASVYVVKHAQHRYEWPSVMVFDCERCRTLTPEFVQDDKRNPLFDFAWAERVGTLPGEWNHLVGYDPPNESARLVHFTQGIPCWPETVGCEFSDEWNRLAAESVSTVTFEALMGQSVHAPLVRAR